MSNRWSSRRLHRIAFRGPALRAGTDLRPVYLGDALFSCQPLAEAVLATGADFLFVCKKDGHKTLYEFVEGAPLDELMVTERRPGKHTLTYRYRWIESVPLRDGKDALAVNWLGVSITDSKGKTTYDGAFVTSLPLTTDKVVEVAACARACWKIENESFNVLKNNGYNLAHNFGHGKKYLARIFAALNLWAFAFHTANDCLETLWQQAREAKGSRTRFFEHIRTVSAYFVFSSWESLMNTLISCQVPPTWNCCQAPTAFSRIAVKAAMRNFIILSTANTPFCLVANSSITAMNRAARDASSRIAFGHMRGQSSGMCFSPPRHRSITAVLYHSSLRSACSVIITCNPFGKRD